MQRQIMHGKIHRATVTEAHLDYPGSITIDKKLMDKAGILHHEKVLIANLTNGSRIESYAIPGPAGSGVICLNGGAAKHGKAGDMVIILAFGVMSEKEAKNYQPKIVYVDRHNRIVKKKSK
ncbi:MAG TPA: aspartate 1-decarboxylase [Candidatus Omnitrophota bacterium]|nr:aspartate 1-decarboxylase [Candidatus Omnitrophota bacterium]HRY85087.1 aspartate 1-decarboxylase [Candidatus Omnitrophota bacterium]